MRFVFRSMLVVCTLLLFAAQAQAAARTFTVFPFAVEGSSTLSVLEDGIPSMFGSRLHVKGSIHNEPLDSKPKPVSDAATAKSLLAKSGADYGIWGVVSGEGNNITVNVTVLGKDGKEWKRSLKTTQTALPVGLDRLAESIKTEVFGIGVPAGRGGQQAARAPLNQAFVSNEPLQRQSYLNPQFRYQGADNSRTRSQALNFAAVGMEIADVTGDKKNEIIILDDHKLLVFEWGIERMRQLGEYKLPMTEDALNVRAIDLNGDGVAEVVVTMFDPEHTMPRGMVLSFKGGQFTVLSDRNPFYLNVVKMPPEYRPVLVGQRGEAQRIFAPAGVYEMMLNGDKLSESKPVQLPKEANSLNFAWLPGSKGDPERLVVLLKSEHLAVYTNKLNRMYATDEKYSGSALGIENQMNMPGLGKDTVLQSRMYHIPLRMVPVDLEGRGDWTLLVNKPISVAAQFFDRYRFYPEGEIHDLFWDGVGLSLLWKTRRIKGSVVDFDVADIANDGSQYLVVCINTHPGALGFSKRRTVVIAYPLDLSQTDPNTPIVIE